MKMIAVSASSNCIKDPRCSFCYGKNRTHKYNGYEMNYTINKIIKRHVGDCDFDERDYHQIADKLDTLTICIEYSGYNIGILDKMWYFNEKFCVLTMTTMPQVVTPIFAGYIANNGVKAVSLSYDNEKVESPSEWAYKARILKDAGIPYISCNYLLAPGMNLDIPEVIFQEADQINYLSFKPNGKLTKTTLDLLQSMILLYQSRISVATDNCLAVQLGTAVNCMAGKEFVHVLPDGKVVDCCYEDDCYLWENGK